MMTFGMTFGRPAVLLEARSGHRAERLLERGAQLRVLEIAGGGNNDVLGGIGAAEMVAQPLLRERLDALLRPENRPPERVPFPERLRENLVHEIVGRVLDHLDFFEDDFLLALDVDVVEGGTQDDVGQDVDRDRHVLVEHLHVVARVFLGGERVELAADRIDRLRDVLGRARSGALEQHVLDEMSDAALFVRLVARAARQPDAEADRPHVAHRFSDETYPVVECVANNHGLMTNAAGDERVESELKGS